MDKVLSALVDTLLLPDKDRWVETGVTIGKLYTDKGLPIDMAITELKKKTPNLSQTHIVAVISGASSWLVEHKRNSGATEKSIERQRNTNNKMILDYLNKGEVGLY